MPLKLTVRASCSGISASLSGSSRLQIVGFLSATLDAQQLDRDSLLAIDDIRDW